MTERVSAISNFCKVSIPAKTAIEIIGTALEWNEKDDVCKNILFSYIKIQIFLLKSSFSGTIHTYLCF